MQWKYSKVSKFDNTFVKTEGMDQNIITTKDFIKSEGILSVSIHLSRHQITYGIMFLIETDQYWLPLSQWSNILVLVENHMVAYNCLYAYHYHFILTPLGCCRIGNHITFSHFQINIYDQISIKSFYCLSCKKSSDCWGF